jgi:hypothetical protein
VTTATYTCPVCGRTSWNPNDARERYCGACHGLTSASLPPGMRWVLFVPAGGELERFGRLLEERWLEPGGSYSIAVGAGAGDYVFDGERFVPEAPS